MFGRAASLQAKKVMSLGHLRRQVDIARSIVWSAADELLYDVCTRVCAAQFDSIDVEQTGFIKQEQVTMPRPRSRIDRRTYIPH